MWPFISFLFLASPNGSKWKKSTSLPELWGGVYFTTRIMKQSNLPPELSKTVQIIPSSDFLWRVCYSNNGFVTVTVVLTFSFFLFVFI